MLLQNEYSVITCWIECVYMSYIYVDVSYIWRDNMHSFFMWNLVLLSVYTCKIMQIPVPQGILNHTCKIMQIPVPQGILNHTCKIMQIPVPQGILNQCVYMCFLNDSTIWLLTLMNCVFLNVCMHVSMYAYIHFLLVNTHELCFFECMYACIYVCIYTFLTC